VQAGIASPLCVSNTRPLISDVASRILISFSLTNTCLDKSAGIARLEEAIVDIRTSIQAAGGQLVVKMEPKAVTESDDAELQALMEKRERENAEVSGDESLSESDDNIPETV